MTESNIDYRDINKHGTLTLGETRIVGTIESVTQSLVTVRIDGADQQFYTRKEAGWTFEPSPEPLPTTPGFYQDSDGDAWLLSSAGGWVLLSDGPHRPSESSGQNYDGHPEKAVSLVRLIPES